MITRICTGRTDAVCRRFAPCFRWIVGSALNFFPIPVAGWSGQQQASCECWPGPLLVLVDYPQHTHSDTEFQYMYTCTGIFLYTVCTVPVPKTNTLVHHTSAAAHPSQLIHFSSLPCTTIHQSKALGLSITTVYGTSSGELIQCQFASSLFTVN